MRFERDPSDRRDRILLLAVLPERETYLRSKHISSFIPIIAALIAFFPSLHFQPYLLDQALWLIFLFVLMVRRWDYMMIPIVLGALCIWQGLHVSSQFFDITNPNPLWVLIAFLICDLTHPGDVKKILFTMIPIVSVRLLLGRATIINSSMDAMFLASTLPLIEGCHKRYKPYWLALPIVAILYSGSSTGLLCLAITSVYYLRWYALWYPLALAMALVTLPVEYLDSGGRYGLWEKAILHLWHSPHRLFGLGVDSFTPIMSKVEIDHGAKQLLFVQSHNEFIKVLFEFGFVGLFFVLLFLAMSFKRLGFKQRIVFLSLIAGACLLNPTGHPLTLLLILTLL